MKTRTFVPQIGTRVKLRSFSEYTSRNIPVWAWLEVQDIRLDLPGMELGLEVLNGSEKTGHKLNVPLTSIESPIGWKPRYTIHVSEDKIPEVLSWFERGIVVRQSQYISDGSTAFQPLDNSSQPHWKFGEITDTIPPEQCTDVFRIVKLETEYDVGIPAPCRYCIGGKRTPENNPVLIGQDTETCPHCGAVAGFSFDKPYHARHAHYMVNPTREQLSNAECANVRQAGECWVCNGSGIGKRYLSELSRKERNQAITAMRADGWKVHYIRRGEPTWMRERETVIHDTEVGINALK